MAVQGISNEALFSNSAAANTFTSIPSSYEYSGDAQVLSALTEDSDSVELGGSYLYKSLTVTAEEILYKLNQLLADELPEGIESLKPEQVTPEATADRIVNSIGGLFQAFAKQNSSLDSEELIAKFMAEARKGVEQGYNDAATVLEDLGAFQVDGVKDGVEKTKGLIEEKLKVLESKLREQLGVSGVVSDTVKSETLRQAGGSLLDLKV